MAPFDHQNLGETLRKLQCVDCNLVYYDPAFYGDSHFYAELSQNDWYYESDKWEFDVALDLIRRHKPTSALEIGCGSGQFLEKIHHAVPNLLGLDINQDALAMARAKGLPVSDQDMSKLDRHFDMVVMFQVLEHLPNPMEWLKKMVSCLNPGGILVIAVPNPDGYLREIDTMILDMPPHHNTGWSRQTFEFLQAPLGLTIADYKTETIKLTHYYSLIYSIVTKMQNRKFINLLVRLLLKFLVPFMFISQRHQILGQTHLITYQKLT